MIRQHTFRGFVVCKKRRRRAMTLVEVMLVATLTGMILGATGILLHTMMNADSQVRSNVAFDKQIGRLSQQFRRDAHTAVTVQVSDQPDSPRKLTFAMPDGAMIEYEAQNNRVVRIKSQGGRIEHRDSFRFSENSQGDLPNIGLELQGEPPRQTAVIDISSQLGEEFKENPPVQAIRLEATIGLSAS